jgi:Pectate lyase superfamily protein
MPRHSLVPSLGIAFIVGCGAQSGPAVESGERVSQRGSSEATIRLSPSGHDDTAALQAALDAASISAQPTTILLGAGTFVTGPLHVKNFRGTLRGAGKDRTVLTNPNTPVYVTPDFQLNEPSATNTWSAMIVFVRGAFTVSDLSVRIHGDHPTTGWNVFGETVYAYAVGLDVEGHGGSADASFERVAILAERVSGDPFGIGSNVFNGIYFQGLIGFPSAGPPPTSGSFAVHDSEFRGVGSGAPTGNLRDARVRIEGNTFDTAFDATEIGDSTGLDFVFAGNQVTAGFSAYTPFDLCLGPPAGCGLSNSSVSFAANRVNTVTGFYFDNRPFAAVQCHITGNDVTYESAAVYLGPETRDCLVVSAGTVQDDGTNNRVIQTR